MITLHEPPHTTFSPHFKLVAGHWQNKYGRMNITTGNTCFTYYLEVKKEILCNRLLLPYQV